MRRALSRSVAFLLALSWLAPLSPAAGQAIQYPPTRRVGVVDDYHGTKVPDPYRWLEDLDSPETREWIEAQNRLTFGFLSEIPERERIRRRLTEIWDYERWSPPVRRGGSYFFVRNDGLQNQGVLYVTDGLEGTPRVLLDPNTLSPDGTVALSGWDITEDGGLLAYGLSDAGSDWITYRVRDVDSGRDRPDEVHWVKFSRASWTRDGSGFFYSRYDEPAGDKLESANYFHKLYFHRLGTPQSQDRLVYHQPDQKEWQINGQVTDDGRYLIISVSVGTEDKQRIYYRDLQESAGPVVKLIDVFEAKYWFIDNDGPIFWFQTDRDAPRGRIIAVDIRRPQPEHWREVIPQSQHTLDEAHVVGGRFIVSYMEHAASRVRFFDLAGRPAGGLELPGIGSAGGFTGRRQDRESFYFYTDFSTPGSIYRYDFVADQAQVFRRPKLKFEPKDYVTTQVFYTGKDGTRVPMFICHRKGLPQNGEQPTYLYGYGGFNISLNPAFRPETLAWMEMGGVYAMPNLRGGGEYGKEWHEAGRLRNKQNVFDDFIAAAEYLINSGYTRSGKLAIGGRSNGGLLVGACMTQRPDLFAAALPAVGVMDMLRFHKFTIGWAWTQDYGSPDDPEMFKVLYAYSPYHHLKPGTAYPATLITTADHDDRVVPCHSFKFAAALQAAQAGDAPVLIRIETRAGHGSGKPTSKLIEEAADRWAFLVRALGM